MTDFSKTALPAESFDYDTAVSMTAAEIQRLLKGAPAAIRHMTGHLAKATGKMIRARSLLACALKQDGTIHPDAVRAAASAELLHLATLVHDDIIDNADKRRGIDTLHRKFGEKHAVLCGDYLFCTALEFVSSVSEPQRKPGTLAKSFPHYLTEVCLGELRQNQNNRNYRLSEREYFKIIRGKTAALFEACFYAGFVLSDAADEDERAYADMGNHIGTIFQLIDDCSDYESTRKITKKPVLSDYSRGVITLPLIYALKKDKSLLEGVKAGTVTPAQLKAAVEAAGGLIYTHAKVDALFDQTLALLGGLALPSCKRALLTALLYKAAGRSDLSTAVDA